jgi:hypothetical protein
MQIFWSAPTMYGLANVSGYHLDLGYDDRLAIARLDNGVSTFIAMSDNGPQFHLAAGKTYVASFGRSKGTLQAKVYQKGTRDPGWQLTVDDETYSGNYFGISTWNTLGFLDNVDVHVRGPVDK